MRAALIAGLVPIFLAVVVACDRPAVDGDGRAVFSGEPAKPSRHVIDSALPIEDALRRFRAGLTPPRTLNGATSRDELVRKFMRGVRARDPDALRALTIDRAEYAYLVYPDTRLSKPPYRQPPEIGWILLQAETNGAIRKLLREAGAGLSPVGYRCPTGPETEGRLRITSNCVVRVRQGERERELRLFGRIIERDGRYKFGGLAGDL